MTAPLSLRSYGQASNHIIFLHWESISGRWNANSFRFGLGLALSLRCWRFLGGQGVGTYVIVICDFLTPKMYTNKKVYSIHVYISQHF